MGRPEAPLVSVVVPMYNEEEVLEQFFSRIESVMDDLNVNYEIVCVNDGSRDNTLAHLVQYSFTNERVKIVDLSRNFGKEQALSAGLEFAKGEAVVCIDADLQDPPELIGAFLDTWRSGYDMVYGVRDERNVDSLMKRMTAGWFYRIFNMLSSLELPEHAGDFRLLDRRIVDILCTLPERNRFMKGLYAWIGFRSKAIPYRRAARAASVSKWNYWRLWNFALDGITGFSTTPLRVWTYFGFAVASLALLYGIYIVTKTIVIGVDVPGYASLMAASLFLGGVQLISLGVIGEYVGRLFHEAKGRPLYIVNRFYDPSSRHDTGNGSNPVRPAPESSNDTR